MSNLIQYIVQDDPEEELKKKQSQSLLSRELPSRQNTDKNYKFSSRHLLENSFNSLPSNIIKISESTLPMNIQGKTWGNFQGKQYDVNDPEQNIELSVRVLKSMYDAVPDKDIAKIATLWNGTGLKEVNDYGARAKEYYKNKTWNNPLEMPEF